MENIQLSLFRGYSDTVPGTVMLQSIVNLIQNDSSVRMHTEKYRHYRLQDNTAAAAAREKSACPCFAVAVRFEGGKRQEHIDSWTGLSIVDIDNIPNGQLPQVAAKVRNSPHTLLSYITISGKGLRILFKTDLPAGSDMRQKLKSYRQLFDQGNRHYAELTGCACDLKCKNATRLSGLAHDPEVYFNPQAVPFHATAPLSANSAPERHINHSRLLKQAVAAARRKLAKEEVEYVPHHRNEYIMRMGYLLNAYGVAQDKATAWATTEFADYDGSVESIIQSCYQHTEEHNTLRLQRGRPAKQENEEAYANVADIEQFLNSQAAFRHNVITRQCEVAFARADEQPAEEDAHYTPLTDRDVNTLWSRMNKISKRARLSDIYNVLHSEFVPQFHPFMTYLLKLKPWDGVTDYIGALADTIRVKSDQEVFKQYFRKWFVNILPGLFEEHSVNHEILVLIGPQGSYKTTWFSRLLPPELQRYFYTKMNSGHITKDDQFTLTEFALICLEEIDEMRPADLSQLKAMITMKNINERAAYGRNKEHRPHIASFCGTGNNLHFLNDPTGNRRWLPFEVVEIQDPNLHPFNYEGIYSQAFALWKGGFRYWFSREEIAQLNRHNQAFESPNLEKELILMYFRRPMPGEESIFVTTAYILNRINAMIKQPLSATKIGIIMKQLGFECVRYSGQRGYKVVEYTAEQIELNRKAAARYLSE